MAKLTTNNITDAAVTEDKLATGAVTETKIGAGAVTEAKIGAGAVTEGKIGTGAVTNTKIGADAVDASKLDETDDYTWTGTHSFTGGTITVPSPSGDNDAASKAYVDNVALGLKWKEPVAVRAQGNIVLSGPGATIDGEAMSLDDRVLCDQQSTGTEDGIYLWKGAAVAMVRAPDAQVGDSFAGAAMFVEKGTDADRGYVCTNDSGSDVIGTDALTMTVFAGTVSAHALGGASHTADTLANLNSKVSDATLIDKGSANTFTEKQTFTSGAATDAPAALTPMAADPSSPVNGDIWITTGGAVRARANGATINLNSQPIQQVHKVTAGEVTAGFLTLANTPLDALHVTVDIFTGIRQMNKQVVGATGATPDFDVLNGNELHINNNGAATGLSGNIIADDILIITYMK
jgi:hypothetical protein